ncbi:MAG: PIG-L family deacetylase, partial [Vicinamibacterales bacterium]
MRRLVLIPVLLAAALSARGQHQLQPIAALRGEPALELALRKLDTIGTLMMTTAHPDDENNAMLAYYGHSKGLRTALVTATRGEGGQNEIGPELFEALAVLRTEELLAAHRYDGAEQYFTRAVDFGYSFSI